MERCELFIVEGGTPGDPAATEDTVDESDSLESRLVVRLHCKHGTSTHPIWKHT